MLTVRLRGAIFRLMILLLINNSLSELFENSHIERPQSRNSEASLKDLNFPSVGPESPERNSVERKGTTSYAFMKSQVIDNAMRNRKAKTKTKIIIGEKRKVSNVKLDDLKSDSKSRHGDLSIKSGSKHHGSSSLILLKQHNLNKSEAGKSEMSKDEERINIMTKERSREHKKNSSIQSRSQLGLNPVKINAHSVPPKRIRVSNKPKTVNLTPNKQIKQTTSLPNLKTANVSKKHLFLQSLREENNRIRDELKQISKQLSLHINRQLREKSNFGSDIEKEIKFLDGNLQNEIKRLEIIQYEHAHLKHTLSSKSNENQAGDLKAKIKELQYGIEKEMKKNKSLKIKNIQINRDFNSTDPSNESQKQKMEALVKELDYTTEKLADLNLSESKRALEMEATTEAYEKFRKDYNKEAKR